MRHARSNPFGAGSRLFSLFFIFAQPEGIKCTAEMHSLVPRLAHQTYVSLQSLQAMAISAASASLSSCSPALPAECGEGGAQPNKHPDTTHKARLVACVFARPLKASPSSILSSQHIHHTRPEKPCPPLTTTPVPPPTPNKQYVALCLPTFLPSCLSHLSESKTFFRPPDNTNS